MKASTGLSSYSRSVLLAQIAALVYVAKSFLRLIRKRQGKRSWHFQMFMCKYMANCRTFLKGWQREQRQQNSQGNISKTSAFVPLTLTPYCHY
jgi:hypothetical protein